LVCFYLDPTGRQKGSARLTYRAPRDGVDAVHATSFDAGRGEFTRTVREKQ